MTRFIVTTTINPPTDAIRAYSQMADWVLIVVGDRRTPQATYEDVDCIYLDPETQARRFPALSEALGWNNAVRRNIGFVEAYSRGAEIVATVDDDNVPLPGWGRDLLVGREVEVMRYETSAPIFDPLAVAPYRIVERLGYGRTQPISQRASTGVCGTAVCPTTIGMGHPRSGTRASTR